MVNSQIDIEELPLTPPINMWEGYTHVPNLFIVDTSESMKGEGIELINEGLELFVEEVVDLLEMGEWLVEVSLVTFGSEITVEQDFKPIDEAWMDAQGNPDTPTLSASGSAPMCEAIVEGFEHLENYKDTLRMLGLSFNRPFVWLLTDGKPDSDQQPGTTKWNTTQDLIERGTENLHLFFFAAAVREDADLDLLEDLVSVGNETLVHAFDLEKETFEKFIEVPSGNGDTEAHNDGKDYDDVLPDETYL